MYLMFYIIIDTLSWGVTTAFCSLIISVILESDRNRIKNIVFFSFIYGCIRGYTGENVFTILLN
jgi:hypothetical protein